MILFYIFILLMVFSINEFMIYIYYFFLANQLASIKKDWNSLFRKGNNIRKFSDISLEFLKYIDRVIYPEEIFGILFKKYYTDFPLLLSELDT
jgi:hypothetical protein